MEAGVGIGKDQSSDATDSCQNKGWKLANLKKGQSAAFQNEGKIDFMSTDKSQLKE